MLVPQTSGPPAQSQTELAPSMTAARDAGGHAAATQGTRRDVSDARAAGWHWQPWSCTSHPTEGAMEVKHA